MSMSYPIGSAALLVTLMSATGHAQRGATADTASRWRPVGTNTQGDTMSIDRATIMPDSALGATPGMWFMWVRQAYRKPDGKPPVTSRLAKWHVNCATKQFHIDAGAAYSATGKLIDSLDENMAAIGPWIDAIPGSVGEALLAVICQPHENHVDR